MITYELYNVEGEPPRLNKVITVGDERFTISLTHANEDELDLIDEETVTQQMNNMAAYTAWLGSGVEILPLEEAEQSAYPLRNADTILQYMDDTSKWWRYLYFRNENAEGSTSAGGSS